MSGFQNAAVLIVSFLLAVGTLLFGFSLGFFRLPIVCKLSDPLKGSKVVGAFSIFLFVQLFIIPLFLILYIAMQKNHLPKSLGPDIEGWFTVAAMLLATFSIVIYSRLLDEKSKNLVWNRKEKKGFFVHLKSYFIGVFFLLFSYPLVFFIGQGISLLLNIFFGVQEIEQVPVKSLKAAAQNPSLYIFLTLSMIFFVPIMEELLFRGFLQTWLRGKMHFFYSIGLASLIFALFHYSHSQGLSNIVYIAALFIFSCFLGFLYEKQKSIWASIGLHAAFNAASIAFISFS